MGCSISDLILQFDAQSYEMNDTLENWKLTLNRFGMCSCCAIHPFFVPLFHFVISKFNNQIVWFSTRMRWMTHCIGKLETDFESVWNVFMLCNIYPFIQQLSNSRVVTCTNAPLLVTQWGEILSEEALLLLGNCVFTKYT